MTVILFFPQQYVRISVHTYKKQFLVYSVPGIVRIVLTVYIIIMHQNT